MFAGSWTGPGHYVCSVAPGDGPDADVVLVDVLTGDRRVLARGGFLSVTAVSADGRFVLARRGPRGYRHIVLADVATGEQRRILPVDAPGGLASEDGRFGPDGASVYLRASLPGPPGADRAGLVVVPLSPGGEPGEGRTVLYRPDADLDGYALRSDGTVLAVWTVDEVTELCVHALSDGALIRTVAAARAGHAGLVAGRGRDDDGRRADRAARAAGPVGRPARRSRAHRRRCRRLCPGRSAMPSCRRCATSTRPRTACR